MGISQQFKQNYNQFKNMANARGGKATSRAVTATKNARSSGVTSAAKNTRMGKMIMKNPKASVGIGVAGVAGLGLARSRRSGLDKGRKGMYNY